MLFFVGLWFALRVRCPRDLAAWGSYAATGSGHGLSLCAVGYSQQAAAAVQSSAVLRVKGCNP